MLLEEFGYNQPGHLIRRAHQLAWSKFVKHTSSTGLTAVQFGILLSVLEFPAIDATRIAELLSIDKTTIGDIIQRLVNKGLLLRETNAKDKRSKRVELTDEGRRVVQEVIRVRAAIADDILSPLTPRERATLIKLLRKLVDIDRVIAMTLVYARDVEVATKAEASTP